ncbi:MAG: hypothetical protein ACQETL_19770, partial [Bacteroidota bacterium]
ILPGISGGRAEQYDHGSKNWNWKNCMVKISHKPQASGFGNFLFTIEQVDSEPPAQSPGGHLLTLSSAGELYSNRKTKDDNQNFMLYLGFNFKT